MQKTVKIVTYHYVRDVEGTKCPGLKALSVADFRRQIEWISRNGIVVSTREVVDAIEGKRELPDNSYCLTFDDAYREHKEVVVPILQEYGMTGTFFIPIRAVTQREVLDVNKIQFLLAAGVEVEEIREKVFDEVRGNREKYSLRSDVEYWQKCAVASRFDNKEVKFVKNMLQNELPLELRKKIIDELFEEYVSRDEEKFADELYLSVEDIQTLKREGMEIGSHGYDHVWLGRLEETDQEKDMKQARWWFDTLGINETGWLMCYPYGSYNYGTVECLKRNGCRAAFTTQGGETRLVGADRYGLNRMDTNELKVELSERLVGPGLF